MVDLSRYYQQEPVKNESIDSIRFPENHVRFSPFLKILQLIDWLYQLLGLQAFKLQTTMLKEFDRASPYDRYQGTEQELKELRMLIISYCNAIDRNPYISSIGRYLLKSMGSGMLRNRKKVLQFYDANKDFVESNGKFNAPVLITGSSRSGTTLLQRLISEDPNTRSPYTYELEIPLPPLTKPSDPLLDQRIKQSSAGIKTLSKLAPGFIEKFAESHVWSSTEMEESFVYTLAHNGINEMNWLSAGKLHLNDVLTYADKRALFKYEQLFYQILDAYRPARSHWTLKAPDYALYFPLIFEEYKDPKVVITHRNPLITLPSLCRIWESWCIAFDLNGTFDKHRFGQLVKMIQEKYLNVPLHYRNTNPESENQIFDCIYDEFFADPISMVKKIYAKFDLEYSREFEDRMIVYLKNNQQGKYGRHKYSLEEYGFSAESVFEEYKDYMDTYGFGIVKNFERQTSFNFLKPKGT